MIAPLLLAAVQAAAPQGAWRVADGRATVTAAGIGVPIAPGSLSLTETGEASRKGDGVDDVAQYRSPDGKLRATVYIFRAAYADTALAAWQMNKVIRANYGSDVRLVDEGAVAAGPIAGALLRARFDGAVVDGQPIATLSGFVRASSWLVGLRVSGPAERQREAEAAFDALAAGLSFAPGLRVYPARPLQVQAPCPPTDDAAARPLPRGKDTGAQVLGAAIGGGSMLADLPDKTGKPQPPLAPAFPANGLTPVCVRGAVTLGKNRVELLQPAGEAEPAVVLGVTDDAGGMFTFERALIGRGYYLQTYGVAVKEVRGGFDRLPSLAQMQALTGGGDPAAAAVRARVTVSAAGKTDVAIDPSAIE